MVRTCLSPVGGNATGVNLDFVITKLKIPCTSCPIWIFHLTITDYFLLHQQHFPKCFQPACFLSLYRTGVQV